jgi:signal transduction histidine kinase
MNGRISVVSREGEGSAFHVDLTVEPAHTRRQPDRVAGTV